MGPRAAEADCHGLKLADAICRASPASTSRVAMLLRAECSLVAGGLWRQRPSLQYAFADNVENVIRPTHSSGMGRRCRCSLCRDPKRASALTYPEQSALQRTPSTRLSAMTWEIGDAS